MVKTDFSKNYSVLIDCPDCYLDVLSIFFRFLNKNWVQRECAVYISTQNKEIECPKNVYFIKCGENKNSIQRSVFAMQRISTKYIITLNSDDFIAGKISNQNIERLIDFMASHDAEYMQIWKLKNKEQRKYRTDLKDIYYRNRKARYSKSLMANIWYKNRYINLFSSTNENGWSIEGLWLKECLESEQGYDTDYYYCDSDPLLILHAISKGCWIRKSYRKLRRMGFSKEELSHRKRLSIRATIKQNCSMFLLNHFSSKTFLKFKTISARKNSNTTDY